MAIHIPKNRINNAKLPNVRNMENKPKNMADLKKRISDGFEKNTSKPTLPFLLPKDKRGLLTPPPPMPNIGLPGDRRGLVTPPPPMPNIGLPEDKRGLVTPPPPMPDVSLPEDATENAPVALTAANSAAAKKDWSTDSQYMNAVDQLSKNFDLLDTAGRKWWNPNVNKDGKISKDDLKAAVGNKDCSPKLRDACQFLLDNPSAFDQLESMKNGKCDGKISKTDLEMAKANIDEARVKENKKADSIDPSSDTASTNGVSVEQLRQIMPNLSLEKAEAYLPYLNKAMAEANIDTPERQAAFLAQLAHESGEFRYMEEIASGKAYEGRADLGNTQPGDGERFKGRGPIQLTGRANYQAASDALGIDLVNNPERAADPDVGFRTAAWFWTTRGLNELADKGDFLGITRKINGGTNGLADRQAYYERALQVLGG